MREISLLEVDQDLSHEGGEDSAVDSCHESGANSPEIAIDFVLERQRRLNQVVPLGSHRPLHDLSGSLLGIRRDIHGTLINLPTFNSALTNQQHQ